MTEQVKARGVRKQRVGRVVSDKMQKGIVVLVERHKRHPLFGKVMKLHKRLYAHDERDEAKVGDKVRIEETRPLSRLKRWRLVDIIEKAKHLA